MLKWATRGSSNDRMSSGKKKIVKIFRHHDGRLAEEKQTNKQKKAPKHFGL